MAFGRKKAAAAKADAENKEEGAPEAAGEGAEAKEETETKSAAPKSSKVADADDENKEIGPENGPRKMRQRGCTDCFCIIIAFAFGLGLAYISYLAWTYGEPYQIIYGKDYLGNRCGVGAFRNRSKTVYPRIDQDLLAQSAIATTQPWKVVFYGICVEACPDVQDPRTCLTNPDDCIVRDYGTPSEWGAAGGAAYYFQVLPTLDVLNRCVPTRSVDSTAAPDKCAYPICDNVTNPWMQCDAVIPQLWTMRTSADRSRCEVMFQEVTVSQFATPQQSPLTAQIATKMAFVSRVLSALYSAQQEVFLFGLVAPVVLGVSWLILLRLFAKTIVWLSLLAVGGALLLLTLYLFLTSGALDAALAELTSNSSALPGLFSQFANATGLDPAALANATSGAAASVFASANTTAGGASAAFVNLAPDELTAYSTAAATSNPLLYQIAAWVSLVVTVIYLIVLCISQKKIRLAATLIKEATIVIKDRPSALLFPFVVIALQVPIILYFVFFFIMLGTANIQLSTLVAGTGDVITAGSSYAETLRIQAQQAAAAAAAEASAFAAANNVSSNLTSGLNGVDLTLPNVTLTAPNMTAIVGTLPPDPWWFPFVIMCYFLFGVLWSLEVVKNTGWTALSGNVSDWYFFRRDAVMRSRFPLARALWRVIRYHLGTILFGSFIIALIQLIRIIMQYIDKQTQGAQEQNKLLKLAVKGIQVCLWCFEKTVKFITNYCYIYVAMQGSGFCKSCFATFSLILSQPAQLALNTLVRTVLSLIQLIGIPCLCGWVGHELLVTGMLSGTPNPEPLYPAAVVLACSLVITMAFSLVMSCSLDTLFVCCVRDKNEYKGAFMSDRLYGAFGFDKSDRKEKRAAKKAAKAEKAAGGADAGGADAGGTDA